MASTFQTDFAAAAVEALLAQFGQPITYTPGGGAAVTPYAIVGDETVEEEETLDGRRRRLVRTITLATDPDLTTYGGVAAPALDDTVMIGSATYAVEAIEAESDNFTRLRIMRKPAIEKTRPGYRRAGK